MPVHPFGPTLPPKKSHKKLIIVIMLVLFVFLISGVLWWFRERNSASRQTASTPAVSNSANTNNKGANNKSRIRLIATGDFVFHDALNLNAKTSDGSYDYLQFMSDFKPVFEKADIRFCNQVTLIGGAKYGISGYPKFNAPLEAVSDMSSLGCNLINMASNHSFNKNQDVIDSNVDAWEGQQNILAAAGQNRSLAERNKVHYFTVDGVKFAFLAYTTYINTDSPAQNNYGVTVYSRALANKQISEAKTNGAQVIIASMRWGTEYTATPNAAQKTEAQYLADQGVELILGHGTHILQPVDTLTGKSGNKTVVWYGLGNFLNMQVEPEGLFNGIAVIDFDPATHQITNQGFLPFFMSYTWTAAQKKADDTNSRKNPRMYTFDKVTQEMIDAEQQDTTLDTQTQRLKNTLNKHVEVPLLSLDQYLNN